MKCIDIQIETQPTVKTDNNFRRLHFILSHLISSLIAQRLVALTYNYNATACKVSGVETPKCISGRIGSRVCYFIFLVSAIFLLPVWAL